MTGGLNGICSPSQRSNLSGSCDAGVAVRGNGDSHSLGKGHYCAGNFFEQAQPLALRCTDDSIHSGNDCSPHFPDFAVGGVLSLAMSFDLGIQLLFLDRKLFHSWLWRRHSPADVAHPGSIRKRHRRHHVWYLRKRPVCNRNPFDRKRSSVANRSSKATGCDLCSQTKLKRRAGAPAPIKPAINRSTRSA